LEIDVIEHLGAESFVYTRLGGATVVVSARGIADPVPGQLCTAHFDPAQVLVFDATGGRIA